MSTSAPPALRPPLAALVAAGGGALLLMAPLAALLLRGGVSGWSTALGDPGVRTALRLTATTSLVATGLAVLGGVPLALVAERARPRVARAAGLVGELPLVVPPVVTGLGLLLVFGRNGLLGGLTGGLTFTTAAVVVAQASVALPLVVVAVRAGLATVDPAPELAAAVHGARPLRRTWLVTMPSIRGAVALGAALAWGRAAGEFGATLTFAGSLPGTTRTLPLEVYRQLQTSPEAAAAVALVEVLLAGGVLVVARRLRDRSR